MNKSQFESITKKMKIKENHAFVKVSFWVHQYEEEERFLEAMAAQGWRFEKLYKGVPTKYEFVKVEPKEVTYQLDYVKTKEDTSDYHQLFLDAGWTEERQWPAFGGHWYYFVKEGKGDRIYTDNESRYELSKKLCGIYGILMLLCMLIELNAVRSALGLAINHNVVSICGILFMICIIPFLAVAIFAGYTCVAIFLKMRDMKRKRDNRA